MHICNPLKMLSVKHWDLILYLTIKMQVCDRRQGFGNPLEKAVYENDCF